MYEIISAEPRHSIYETRCASLSKLKIPMIKLFRKIRYNQISENKTGQYIKYAVGEILLIIIGILIAVQINEWNSNRREQNLLRKNLEYVLIDLKADSEQLLSLKKQRTNAALFCSGIIDKYIQSQEIDFNEMNNNLKDIFYELKFTRKIDGFKKVEANELFQSASFENLRNKINDYESKIKQLTFDEQRLNYFIEENELKMFANGSFIDIYEHLRVKKTYAHSSIELSKLSWLEQLNNNPPFKAILLRFEDDVNQFLIPQYDNTISAGNELKFVIEKYLNSQ